MRFAGRGFLLSAEALASLLVLLGAVMLLIARPAIHESRASELAVAMQAEDVAEFVLKAGGARAIGEEKLEEIAGELSACMRITRGGEELFTSGCFGQAQGTAVAVSYFEIEGTAFSVARLELKKRG